MCEYCGSPVRYVAFRVWLAAMGVRKALRDLAFTVMAFLEKPFSCCIDVVNCSNDSKPDILFYKNINCVSVF